MENAADMPPRSETRYRSLWPGHGRLVVTIQATSDKGKGAARARERGTARRGDNPHAETHPLPRESILRALAGCKYRDLAGRLDGGNPQKSLTGKFSREFLGVVRKLHLKEKSEVSSPNGPRRKEGNGRRNGGRLVRRKNQEGLGSPVYYRLPGTRE